MITFLLIADSFHGFRGYERNKIPIMYMPREMQDLTIHKNKSVNTLKTAVQRKLDPTKISLLYCMLR